VSSYSQSEDYKRFRRWVPLKKTVIETQTNKRTWEYFQFGPKDNVPLIFIPGLAVTSDSFFLQFTSLCAKGFHLIAVQPPGYSTHREWMRALDKFLDYIKFPTVHFFGEGLGGYLLQCFAMYRPKRVESIILCNSFCNTTSFSQNNPISGVFKYLPEIILKKYVLSYFPTKELPLKIIDTIDFMVERVESLKRKVIASRITLNTTTGPLEVNDFPIDQTKITIIDVLDETFFVPVNLRDDVCKCYPQAKQAKLKAGGDFPFITVFDEVNMFIETHLKECGYVFITDENQVNNSFNDENPLGLPDLEVNQNNEEENVKQEVQNNEENSEEENIKQEVQNNEGESNLTTNENDKDEL